MVEYEFSEHAYEMLKERNIKNEWVDKTIGEPDVIINPDVEPLRIVTLFFDRRQRRDT